MSEDLERTTKICMAAVKQLEIAEAERDQLQARVAELKVTLEKWRDCYDDRFDDHELVKKVGPMMANCITETRAALQREPSDVD